jgi:hypothetical protein
LRELAATWGPFVVDYEPTARPDFPEIMDPAISTFEGGVLATNGYGLVRAAEPASVFGRLREFGYEGISLTLHGGAENHDWFVGREGAYQDILGASQRALEAGFGVHWNIFLDRRNLQDVPGLAALKQARFGDSPAIAVPQHTVSRRMWEYEELRPSAAEVRERLPQLPELDPTRWRQPLEERTEAAWLERWKAGSEPDKFADPWEPKSWPPRQSLGSLCVFITRDRQVYLEPLCAPRMLIGQLDAGRPVLEERLQGLPAPHAGIDPDTAAGCLGRTDLLHPTGSSVRYKAISAGIHG